MHQLAGIRSVTYRVTREPGGWVLKRWVAGAACKSGLVIATDLRSLAEATAAAESDIPTALT